MWVKLLVIGWPVANRTAGILRFFRGQREAVNYDGGGMRENYRIADQLRRAVYGEAWHGDAVFELLSGMTAEQAATRPAGGGHSIAELTLHIAAWMEAADRRLHGDPALLLGDDDWPPPQDWSAARERLRAACEVLLTSIEKADLDAAVPGKAYDVYFLLHGVIQHTLYHAGQIAVLKRMT
jgi:uncharacterized damage-inducible protein DinB